MDDYVCINRVTGIDTEYNLDNCESNGGKIINKKDRINPSSGYECRNIKTNERYFSKRECNDNQFHSYDVKYGLAPNRDTWYNKKIYNIPSSNRHSTRL